MKRLKYWLIDYFNLTKGEANGMLVLGFILVFFATIPIFTRIGNSKEMEMSEVDKSILDSLVVIANEKKEAFQAIEEAKWKKNKISDNEVTTLFEFNPNEIGEEDWKKLGMPSFVIERIRKYIEKGGKFKVKSDLLKIYGFPSEKFASLKPYIELPDTLLVEEKKYKKEDYAQKTDFQTNNTVKINIFDLNSADTLQLQMIKGIGSVLAKRIVEYREKLGGFYDFSQLSEVYGLKPEVIEELKKKARLDNVVLRKINVNTSDSQVLGKHPYIGYKFAKIMVNYREQHGKYANSEDLLKIKVLTQEQIQKLQPYLEF
jgi:DNA uptake protein ComE-like DNA-binding protein